jgi:hypothetical protein
MDVYGSSGAVGTDTVHFIVASAVNETLDRLQTSQYAITHGNDQHDKIRTGPAGAAPDKGVATEEYRFLALQDRLLGHKRRC